MMVETHGLKKSYGAREVLRGVDLKIPKGAITGVAGPNGCGKTTLIKCLLGLVVGDTGAILIDGEPVDANGEFRRKIGYMPQNPEFPSNLRLAELLEMISDLRKEEAKAKEELLRYFGLEADLPRTFTQLSGGTKQKFAAVIALMFGAPLIILDEPTAGLDPIARVRLKDLLAMKAKEGKTILFVSHLMSEIEALASHVIFMNDGSLIYSGLVKDVIQDTGEAGLERALTRFFADHQGERR